MALGLHLGVSVDELKDGSLCGYCRYRLAPIQQHCCSTRWLKRHCLVLIGEETGLMKCSFHLGGHRSPLFTLRRRWMRLHSDKRRHVPYSHPFERWGSLFISANREGIETFGSSYGPGKCGGANEAQQARTLRNA